MPNSQWRSRIGRRPHLHVSASKGLRILPVKFFFSCKNKLESQVRVAMHGFPVPLREEQPHQWRLRVSCPWWYFLLGPFPSRLWVACAQKVRGDQVVSEREPRSFSPWFKYQQNFLAPGKEQRDKGFARPHILPGDEKTKWLSSTRLSTRSCYVPGKKVLTLTLV